MLAFQFIKDAGHVSNAGAIRNIMRECGFFIQILEVRAADAAFQNFQAVKGIEAGTNPLAGMGGC